jgi:hypothetical protein
VSEQHEGLKEYRQGDTVQLTVELRDEHGVIGAAAFAFLEGSDRTSPDPEQQMKLTGWAEDEPVQAEVVLQGTVKHQRPGVYECPVIVPENAYGAMSSHELDPPLRFRVVEHPDDIREGPEVLSVGDFW